MKYLSLIVIVGILYLAATQMRSSSSRVKSSFVQAEEEAAQVDPHAAKVPAGSAPAPVSLRAPIQRTEDLKELVKKRNEDGEF
ncbi:MAG: hypothetical protein EOP84_31695 [Verrucomicrobiaceae bacterium]|nr:MAG: hypothetical protein EOP84_31695 [Verrucomicrobiaceae bacterium]